MYPLGYRSSAIVLQTFLGIYFNTVRIRRRECLFGCSTFCLYTARVESISVIRHYQSNHSLQEILLTYSDITGLWPHKPCSRRRRRSPQAPLGLLSSRVLNALSVCVVVKRPCTHLGRTVVNPKDNMIFPRGLATVCCLTLLVSKRTLLGKRSDEE